MMLARTGLYLLFGAWCQVLAAQDSISSYRITEETPFDSNQCNLEISVVDAGPEPLPVRAIVTDSAGNHFDGSGHGLYDDGRFFADGRFAVVVPEGDIRVQLSSGPEYVPVEFDVAARSGIRTRITARLHRWFDAAARGWYGGDNHVHAQHDPTATVKTGLDYAALQGRANGLNFITEAGSNVSYEKADQLDTPSFLLRVARELRPACYTGHLITPGIREPISRERIEEIAASPLPGQAVKREAHARGGVMIYTHPLSPVHQLHWMGAMGAFSDGVMGNCADLMDLDSPETELLWFTLLNLGNRIGASSYTDCSLGRPWSPSPGDRRVYCKAEGLDYAQFVSAMRHGRTFATSGGPVFTSLNIDGAGPGGTLSTKRGGTYRCEIEVQSRRPLRSVRLIRNGITAEEFAITGIETPFETVIDLEASQPGWVLLRAEDEAGDWSITSPVYLGDPEPSPPTSAVALLLEISNATRYIELRKGFFAHIIATVSPEQEFAAVTLLRDGQPTREFSIDAGSCTQDGLAPVTTLKGEYAAGWLWHPNRQHFQADWPIDETGWYAIRAKTARGEVYESDAIRYDAENPNSQTVSVAHLRDRDHAFNLWGYGEEMALEEVSIPFEGDRWWYPEKNFWQITTNFDGHRYRLSEGAVERSQLFRPLEDN